MGLELCWTGDGKGRRSITRVHSWPTFEYPVKHTEEPNYSKLIPYRDFILDINWQSSAKYQIGKSRYKDYEKNEIPTTKKVLIFSSLIYYVFNNYLSKHFNLLSLHEINTSIKLRKLEKALKYF